jgi:hypothetical protein
MGIKGILDKFYDPKDSGDDAKEWLLSIHYSNSNI